LGFFLFWQRLLLLLLRLVFLLVFYYRCLFHRALFRLVLILGLVYRDTSTSRGRRPKQRSKRVAF
jgi:hypothetical protein